METRAEAAGVRFGGVGEAQASWRWAALMEGAEGLRPGTPEAEAVADALLVRARACGRRLAHSLLQAARVAGEGGEGLRRAAEDLLLSSAYHTEQELRRRPRVDGRYVTLIPLTHLVGDRQPVADDGAWVGRLIEEGLPRLAERLGLPGRQAEVWAAHVQGFTLREIAGQLRLSRGSVRTYLHRAHAQTEAGWLMVYRQSVRG